MAASLNVRPPKSQPRKSAPLNRHWLAKENAEINEDYNEAVYKIGKTSLPQDAKDLLLSQAQANKELALKQAKEKSDLMMKNMEAREKFRDQIMQEKRNRKAVREIEDIL